MRYKRIRDKILHDLNENLDPKLYYHNVTHTVDVLNCVAQACRRHAYDNDMSDLMRLAAVGHDMGYLESYVGHEEVSAKLIGRMMEREDYNDHEIQFVQHLILATKIDHVPINIPEYIIRDADLDYLGRDDFHFLSEKLYNEWVEFQIIEENRNDFNNKQIDFLKKHQYYTPFSIKHREPNKLKRISELELLNP